MRAITRAASVGLASLLLASGALAAHAAPTKEDLPTVGAAELDDAASDLALINPSIQLSPEDYHPKNLRTVAGTRHELREEAAAAVEDMLADARKAGYSLQLISAFRSYERQRVLFNQYQAQYGTEYAERISARPGTSEHQLGLAADVGYASGNCQLRACFGDSAAGKWVAEHANDYGLIIRYPQNQEAVTGYHYEPWHVRYIGTEHAKAMRAAGVKTFEEYHGLLAQQASKPATKPSAPAPEPSSSAAPSETATPKATPESAEEDDLLILRFLPPFRDWTFGLSE